MDYCWLDCPRCGCQVAVNYTTSSGRVLGSVRRWSSDRATNDGRPFEMPEAALGTGGRFIVACVCGQDLEVSSHARGGEREAGLRVTLGE